MRIHLRHLVTSICCVAVCLLAFAPLVMAQETQATERTFGGLQGVPASTSITGGGAVPQGRAITAYNISYRDKEESIVGNDVMTNRNIDNSTLVQLVKIRIGVLERMEVNTVIPYTFYNPDSGSSQDSLGDVAVGATYGFLLERLGDPLSLSLSMSAGLPTGEYGADHLAGNGAWAYRAALGLTKTFGLHQVSFDLVGNVPLSAGNQNVEKGNSGSFNYKYAYALTSKLDVGIEGTIDRGWNGERNNAKVKNNYLEWYTGPALSYILPGNSWFQPWCGLGAYFPVYREYGQNTSAESVRVDFKLGLFW